MNLTETYQKHIEFLEIQLNKYLKTEKAFTWIRLFSFLILALISGLLFTVSVTGGIASLVASVLIFGYVLNYHLKTEKKRKKHQYLIEINQAEINALNGNFSNFNSGSEFNQPIHPYSNDLDIFGSHSLFQLINRTSTQPGAERLANWLKKPQPFQTLTSRQEAVKELKEKIQWRQNLRAIFYINPSSAENPQTLINWSNHASVFKNSEKLLKIIVGLTSLTIIALAIWLAGYSKLTLIGCFLLNMVIYYKYVKHINTIQQQLSKTHALLLSYSDILELIEQEDFKSEYLNALKNDLRKEGSPSQILKSLSQLTKRLDFRMNILAGFTLNLFFFWDIHQCIRLEIWKNKYKDNIKNWFDILAEFEALSSLGNLHFNNPEWVFPEIVDSYFTLEAKTCGHPLIISKNRVCNSFTLDQEGKIALVTGSNMSGKSTFLRTLGVNAVLAMMGAPVCAEYFKISYIHVYSSMRIADSLEDNTSSFYAELKKLAEIIKVVEKKERVFLLLDEILRGTNSNDRHTGSIALIRQLIKNNASGILATHDLVLSQIKEEFPHNIDIYNFDVKIEGEELYFDYLINPGICKSLNASLLMRKMGIEM